MKFNNELFLKDLGKIGLNQKDLCKKAGLTEATLSRTINFKRGNFKVIDLLAISEAMNCKIADFIDRYYEF